MIDKVKVILRDGTETTLPAWQEMYGLTDIMKIGRYFSLRESRFMRDLELYGELVVNELLIRFIDGFRERVDHPVIVNSFNRNHAHQVELQKRGFRAASISPHVVKMAMDIDTKNKEQTTEWVKALRPEKASSGIQARIGWKDYMDAGQTFIHIDVCPEYYAPGKPYHSQPHPAVWEKATEW